MVEDRDTGLSVLIIGLFPDPSALASSRTGIIAQLRAQARCDIHACKVTQGQSHVVSHEDYFAAVDAAASHTKLMRSVFGDAFGQCPSTSAWRPIGLFEDGACIAAIETRCLPFVLDARAATLTGIRRVAVDPAWRGRGLFRELMTRAIAWCEAQSAEPILLFTETPKLYERFAFAAVVQHAFEGPPPGRSVRSAPTARRLDPRLPGHAATIDRLLSVRAPVSRRCALAGAPDLVWPNLLADADLVVAHAADLDALIVYEADEDVLLLVDVVAADVPSMAAILAALGLEPQRVTTLFPPDRLGWHAEPRAEQTGLMARGGLPTAMRRPFMLPPTAEF